MVDPHFLDSEAPFLPHHVQIPYHFFPLTVRKRRSPALRNLIISCRFWKVKRQKPVELVVVSWNMTQKDIEAFSKTNILWLLALC